MSALPDSLPIAPRSIWPLPGILTIGVLLVLVGMFWPTFFSMVEIWERSETYTHGFLIFPISAWLIWRKRDVLGQIQPRRDLRGLILLIVAGAGWLLADAGSVSVAAQYALIAMMIAMVWTLLGWTFVWAAFFPLMFLFFAVPVGEFLIQPLMGVTADFTVTMLQFTGIPVYREGTFFSIPSGDWSVIEACSGLRYLIASVTLGSLFAYLTYRSWTRRVIFAVLAIIVPIFANSGRAYMIVMIGHLAGMEHAIGADHLIYGWVFFGFVMLLLFWIGSFWREDDQPEPEVAPLAATIGGARTRPILPVAMLALVIAGLWPAYANWLDTRPLPAMPVLQVEVLGGWQPGAAFTNWMPHWIGADRRLRQAYTQAGREVLLELDYYVTQRQGAELINSQNYMVSQSKYEHWINVGENRETVKIAGQPRQVWQAMLKSKDARPRRLLVWQWNLINQKIMVNDELSKLVLAFDRVRLRRDDGLSVLIATPYEDGARDAAAATLADFAADMDRSIGRTLDQVDGQ